MLLIIFQIQSTHLCIIFSDLEIQTDGVVLKLMVNTASDGVRYQIKTAVTNKQHHNVFSSGCDSEDVYGLL